MSPIIWLFTLVYLLGIRIFYTQIKTELKPKKWVRFLEITLAIFWPILAVIVFFVAIRDLDRYEQ